jgi:antirestriction protein ArdC
MAKFNMREYVTEKIITALEGGPDEWRRPWKQIAATGLPFSGHSGKAYRGINIMLLAMEGRSTNEWRTLKQWNAANKKVAKGEKGTRIVFWKPIDRVTDDGDEDGYYIVCNYYYVFNADQIADYEAPEIEPITFDPSVTDDFIAATEAEILYGGNRAFYAPGPDKIQMPIREAFATAEGYAGTALHELIHWSGAKKRLDRTFGKRFGDRAYAAEELVAEIGAAMLCASLGFESQIDEQHAPYIASWIEVLKSDNSAIFTAASKATDAVDYLVNLTEKETDK